MFTSSLLTDEKEISRETREKYLEIALRKSQRLEELINEFFEMTKYNFSSMMLSLSKVNLSMMLEQMLFEFQPLFDQKNLRCEMDITQELYLNCDVEQLERVFDNLFKNACNYCYPDSVVYVSLKAGMAEGDDSAQEAAAVSDGLVLTVRNSGKTIPKAQQEQLFDQFFRMDSSRSSQTGGSGLGLAIAKEIIRQHGGTICCESENETITFTVFLPFRKE